MADEIPRHLSGYGTDEVQLKRKIPDYDDPGPDDYIPIQVDEQGRRLIDGEPYDFWIEQNADRVDDISDILYRFENNQIDDDRRPFDFKQHAQQAASKAFEDNEGTYRDTGLTSYNETRHPGEAPGGGTLIRASATPFYEYEYDPKAFRLAEMDTKRSEREYEEGLARKEAERTRKGKQDPAPTLGPSMTE